MDPGTEAEQKHRTRIASILMPKALEDGVETTAEAYGEKPADLRGETTCAGKGCGVAVVFQRAHRRKHRDGYVEMFAGFRLAKDVQHAASCDIDVQIGAKRRGVLVVTSKIGAAAAILAMGMDPCGKGRAVNERLLRVRWDAADTPPRITIATPSATFAAARGPGAGGLFGGNGGRRPKRIASAADIERERLSILGNADPQTAADRLAILIGDDRVPVSWSAFFHNWDLNTPTIIARIVEKIERGGAADGVAFAAKAMDRPTRRHGVWIVPCRTVASTDGARIFSLWMTFADRSVACGLQVGKSYVFAGPEVRFERIVQRGMTHDIISVGVLSGRWVAESEEARPEQVDQLRRKSGLMRSACGGVTERTRRLRTPSTSLRWASEHGSKSASRPSPAPDISS